MEWCIIEIKVDYRLIKLRRCDIENIVNNTGMKSEEEEGFIGTLLHDSE